MISLQKILNNIKQKITDKPETVFFWGTLFFGSIFVILIPPFQIPDEFVHFTRSYEVSQLKTPQKYEINGVNHLGAMLPDSVLQTYKKAGLHQVLGYPDVPQAKKYSIADTKKTFQIPLNKSEVSYYDTGASPSYFPLLYAPQALSIAILQFFNAPVIFMLYATRVVGLLIWTVLVMAAFKFIRPASRKLPLAAVLLLPMFISQASASTDPLINGSIVLFIAIITNFIARKVRPNLLYTIILIGILSLTTLSKPVYVIFGLLLFLLPKSFISWRRSLKSILLFVTPILIYVAWGILTSVKGTFYFDSIAVSNAHPSSQLHYIFPNIFNFFQPFMNTLLLNWGDGIYTSLIGMFGKLDTPLPLIFVTLGYLIIFVAVLVGVADQKTQKLEKTAIVHNSKSITTSVLIVAGYVVGVYLAMYIASTPPQEKIVTGVQGRYLLPLIPFAVIFSTKRVMSFLRRPSYELFLIILPGILLVASVVVVFLRYYVIYP